MKKTFTKAEYDNFIKTLDEYINKAENIIINDLPKLKEARQLSFEDWVEMRNRELKTT